MKGNTYIRLGEANIRGLGALGLDVVVAEIGPSGVALREVGFDRRGNAVYVYPGMGPFGGRGLLDNAIFDMNAFLGDMTPHEFHHVILSAQQALKSVK